MRRLISVLAVLLLVTSASAENYLVTSRGIWRIVDGVPEQLTGPGDKVVYLNGGQSEPEPPTEPPTGSLFESLKQITQETVNTELEAKGLVSIARLLIRDDARDENLEDGFNRLVENHMTFPGFAGNRFGDWRNSIKELKPTYNRDFFLLLDQAITETWGLPPGELETTTDLAKFEIKWLVELIKQSLEILKLIGICDKKATFEVAELRHSKSFDKALEVSLRDLTFGGLTSTWIQ